MKSSIKSILKWLANIILNILRIGKRDEKIWLFGAWSGRNYSDNSKYFFEYVNTNLPEIKAIWITKSKNIKTELIKKGYSCYLSHEKQARKLRLSAGYVFFTNGIEDIGNLDLSHGATKVALWHGMPLKRLCFATNNLRKRNKNFLRLLQYYVLKTYNPFQRNITIATSQKTKVFLKECFETKSENIWITGQPRNDALFEPNAGDNLKRKLNHEDEALFVAYMPTHRPYDNEKPVVQELVDSLHQDAPFNTLLKTQNIILYIKPHPNRTLKPLKNSHIKILDGTLDIDPQQFMAAADVLITDYSSVFIDYALLERPVHFYVPDLERYSKKARNGIFLDFKEFSDFWFKDIESFKSAVLNAKEFQNMGKVNAKKINGIYDSPAIEKGKYCYTFAEKLKTSAISFN